MGRVNGNFHTHPACIFRPHRHELCASSDRRSHTRISITVLTEFSEWNKSGSVEIGITVEDVKNWGWKINKHERSGGYLWIPLLYEIP